MKDEVISSSFSDTVIGAIREVLGEGSFSLHEPEFNGKELEYLTNCIESKFVSSVGPFVQNFEEDLTKFTGANYAVAVVNGTAALHIALKLAGVEPGDEVLLPALTFVATANAVSYCGAMPHFVDSCEISLGVNFQKLREYLIKNTLQKSGNCINRETGKIIRSLVVMHTFGAPSDIEGLISLAQEFNLKLVEDAAESLGSYYDGKHTGTFGLLGTLSFNGNKIITTGGGGAILTDSESLAQKAKHLTTTAKIVHPWEFIHDSVGFNYRMPNLNAALGCAQLEELVSKIELKRKLHLEYKSAFNPIEGIKLFSETPRTKSNYWLQTLILDEDKVTERERILSLSNASGIMMRPAWKLMTDLPMYRSAPRMDLSVAKSLSLRILNIPSSPSLYKNTK